MQKVFRACVFLSFVFLLCGWSCSPASDPAASGESDSPDDDTLPPDDDATTADDDSVDDDSVDDDTDDDTSDDDIDDDVDDDTTDDDTADDDSYDDDTDPCADDDTADDDADDDGTPDVIDVGPGLGHLAYFDDAGLPRAATMDGGEWVADALPFEIAGYTPENEPIYRRWRIEQFVRDIPDLAIGRLYLHDPDGEPNVERAGLLRYEDHEWIPDILPEEFDFVGSVYLDLAGRLWVVGGGPITPWRFIARQSDAGWEIEGVSFMDHMPSVEGIEFPDNDTVIVWGTYHYDDEESDPVLFVKSNGAWSEIAVPCRANEFGGYAFDSRDGASLFWLQCYDDVGDAPAVMRLDGDELVREPDDMTGRMFAWGALTGSDEELWLYGINQDSAAFVATRENETWTLEPDVPVEGDYFPRAKMGPDDAPWFWGETSTDGLHEAYIINRSRGHWAAEHLSNRYPDWFIGAVEFLPGDEILAWGDERHWQYGIVLRRGDCWRPEPLPASPSHWSFHDSLLDDRSRFWMSVSRADGVAEAFRRENGIWTREIVAGALIEETYPTGQAMEMSSDGGIFMWMPVGMRDTGFVSRRLADRWETFDGVAGEGAAIADFLPG
ncbi:MAG: hypothetical protein IT350_17985 [Deltaproteobacteria bacterium]|nr:hypothetical protein [Deltaproteobacteria bacterium]